MGLPACRSTRRPREPFRSKRDSLLLAAYVLAVSLGLAFLSHTGNAVASPRAATVAEFPDVPAQNSYFDAVHELAVRGIVAGYTDGMYGIADPVTRQQFAKMIVLTRGLATTENDTIYPPFADQDQIAHVAGDLYPYHYIAKAQSTGLTTGYTDGTFRPFARISRKQVVTMVVRSAAAQLETPPPGWSGMVDDSDPWHGDNLRMAEFNGLLDGLQGLSAVWDENADASRGEVAHLLFNLLVVTEGRAAQVSTGDLLHFWWDWWGDWQYWQTEDITEATGSEQAAGDAYYWLDSGSFTYIYIFAVGVDGDLTAYSVTPGAHDWAATALAAPSGREIRPLLGGRAFNDHVVSTTAGSAKTLHVFALDQRGHLVHFWLPRGGTWSAEDVSATTGRNVFIMGSVWSSADGRAPHVACTGPGGRLLHFWLPVGEDWQVEDLSRELDETIVGEVSLVWDEALPGSTHSMVAAGPDDELLLFTVTADNAWDAEDVTAETGVTLGGWVSWWDWTGTPFDNPLALLDTSGRFVLLERASAGAAWTVTDVSAAIGTTFDADTGGDSILRFHPSPVVPATQVHYTGIDTEGHLIHFWRDPWKNWHSNDLTSATGRAAAHPINVYTSWGTSGSSTIAHDYVCCTATDGSLIFFWADSAKRDWRVFDATAETGYRVCPPELPWGYPSGKTSLVMMQTE